ncbi:MAG: hypothetical protein ACM31O_03460 [Bacteroidota bacterium]
MVAPRASRVPPDVDYVLDCAVDDGDIDAGSHLVLKLYGERAYMLACVDKERDGATSWQRRAMVADLLDHVDGLFAQIAPARRGALMRASLLSILHQCQRLAPIMADWAFQDSVQGGMLEPFRPVVRITRSGQVHKRLLRRLHTASFIHRYTKLSREAGELRALGFRLRRRMELVDARLVRDDGTADLIADLERQREAAQARESAAWIANDARAHGAAAKRDVKRINKVTRRALGAAASVLGEAEVRRFVHGEQLRLTGRSLQLEVRKTGPVTACGYGALQVAVCERNGDKLADLCVFFPGLPALDQLTALALHVEADDGREILEKANITRVTDAGVGHPLLLARPASAARDAAELVPPARDIIEVMPNGLVRQGNYWRLASAVSTALGARYWERTQHIWLEEVSTFVLGHRLLKQARLLLAPAAA